MSSIWGNKLKISLFGESHGPAIGVVIDGLPAGYQLDFTKIAKFAARRAPGLTPWSTPRRETDEAEVLSGLYQDKTTGAPLCAIIRNKDTRSQDYEQLRDKPRPGHADLTGQWRYKGHQDPRGSGHFSGRLTAPLVFAGAVCSQIIARSGVTVAAHIARIGDILDQPLPELTLDAALLGSLAEKKLPVLDDQAGQRMIELVLAAAEDGDSVGGVVEAAIYGLPRGLGNPIFAGLEPHLASLIFGIPAIKGLEFGIGFQSARMRGSEHNDVPFWQDEKIAYKTNHSGGIVGGISNGAPLIFRAAVRPPASIAKVQHTVNLSSGENELLAVRGRHDPCIVPRVTPVVEAAAAVFALDLLLDKEGVAHG